MKNLVMMAIIALLVTSCNLASQDNRQRGQEATPARSEVRQETPATPVVTAPAQGGQARGGERATPEARAQQMAEQLQLTPQQVAQVQALFERQETQLRELATAGGGQQGAMTEEARALRQQQTAEQDAALERIIGAERMAQWRELRGAAGGRGAGMGGNRPQ